MVIGKEKFALWITPEAKKEVEAHYKQDNCKSQSEYIEKAVRFYLKKPVKAQVDAIVDELARLPEVAECYEQWNRLRDELERYYLLTVLYNAPVTIGPYYSAAVRHDFG